MSEPASVGTSPAAMVFPLICERKISDRYYKLINVVTPNNLEVYIFVGSTPEPIAAIIKSIEKNGTVAGNLSDSQRQQLSEYFGPAYGDELGLNFGEEKDITVVYVDDLIEVDDSIRDVKMKIAKHLRTLVDWQYLYASIRTVSGAFEQVCLGHTFIRRKDNKKNDDVIIEYPKDPFDNISLSDPSMNFFVNAYTGIKTTLYQKNDTNSSLISEYEITGNAIYLVTICNFLRHVNQSAIKYTGINVSKFKDGYLAKYWPTLAFENEPQMSRLYESCGNSHGQESVQDQLIAASDFKQLTQKVERDEYIVSLIKNPPEAIGDGGIKFDNCGILEIVLHINYNQDLPEFIDLMKIFDRYELQREIPFVKYKGEKSKEPRHKLYTPVVDENSMDIVQDWISNIQKRKKDDVFEYRVSGKGLSFKRLLYQNVDPTSGEIENKYATINFYKDGKIELKCFWEEHRNATLSDVRLAIIDLVQLVTDINKIEYHSPGINRKMRIPVPDLDFYDNKQSNTQIAFINTVTRFNYGDLINFDKFNDFTACFNTYVSIIKKNISFEYDALVGKNVFKTVMSSALQLRYKRINNYFQMSVVEKFINDIINQTEGVDKLVIIKLLVERFSITQDVAEKIYMAFDANQITQKDADEKFGNIDYVLGKKIRKQPGIDIKIQGQEAGYKIFILGAKSIFQLSLIHQFLKSLLRLYKKMDVLLADPAFKAHMKSGLCQLPENLIDKGIEEGMLEYEKIKKEKKETQIAQIMAEKGVEDVNEEDIDSLMALLGEGPTEEEIDAELEASNSGSPTNTLTEGEEPSGQEGEEEVPPSTPTAAPLPKKPTKFDYTKGVSALMRLKEADPELFKGSNYATRCQSNAFKQPMVVSSEIHEKKKLELEKQLKELKAKEAHLNTTKPEGYQQQLKTIEAERKQITYKLDVYRMGVEYRKNYYFCPMGYEYSTERILHADEIDKETGRDKVTGNPVYWVTKEYKLPHAGFAPPDTHPDGKLCMICCFVKPNTRFDECLGHNNVAPKPDKNNVGYVLAAEKTGIPIGRYGTLPETMNILFNNGIKADNKIMSGYDSYLRKGVNPEPSHNIFLNAVGDSLNPATEGSVIRKLLVSKLTMNNFLSLKSGGLRLVFSDGTGDNQAFQNFSKFVTEDNYIDEDFLWDYITMPGILTAKGFNLFIFESQSSKGKISENIILKCPVGYDVHDLFNNAKPSLIIFKYGTHYEPIYRVTNVNNVIRTIEMFIPEHPIVRKLISMMDQCMPETDLQAYNNEKLLLTKMGQTPLKFEEPFTLKKTYDRLGQLLLQANKLKTKDTTYESLMPQSQIIDEYNKAIYIVLNNGFKIPVKPSSRNQLLPIVEYESVPLQSYSQTLTIAKRLAELTNLPVRPILVLTGGDGSEVIGLLLNNGLAVEVAAFPTTDLDMISTLTMTKIPTDRQYYRSRYDVDKSISHMTTDPQVDTRLHYVNLRKFEDESYQRLRYELSKELQEPQYADLLATISAMIRDPTISIGTKRQELFDLLIAPLNAVVTTVRDPDQVDDPDQQAQEQDGGSSFDYDTYVTPNVRTQCVTKSLDQCPHDPHCSLAGMPSGVEQCKLFIEPHNIVHPEKDNINRYLSLIIEELLKNHLKRTELLTDQVDNTVDDRIFEYRPTELIFKDATYKENKKKMENLYKQDVDYYDRLAKLYDTANPLYYQETSKMQNLLLGKLTDSSCHQGFDTLTIYWGQIVGPSFRRLLNDQSTNCVLYALSLALNQRDSKEGQLHTIQSIRGLIAENVTNLRDETLKSETPTHKARKGWELLLDHYRFLFRDQLKDVYSISDLKDYMKSNIHQLSLIDFVMISQLYDVKFIIMSRKRSPSNPSGFICLGSTMTTKDNYILLYKVAWENYQIVANVAFSPPRYIFTREELPTKLYQHWAEVCSQSDMKTTPDEQIEMLQRAALYKTFDISAAQAQVMATTATAAAGSTSAPTFSSASAAAAASSAAATGPVPKQKLSYKPITSKAYFIDPVTSEVLPDQSGREKEKKLPLIRKKPLQSEIEAVAIAKLIEVKEKKKLSLKAKPSSSSSPSEPSDSAPLSPSSSTPPASPPPSPLPLDESLMDESLMVGPVPSVMSPSSDGSTSFSAALIPPKPKKTLLLKKPE